MEKIKKMSPTRFYGAYQLFLSGQMGLGGLRKEMQTVNDVVFYHTKVESDVSSLDLHLRTVLNRYFDRCILRFLGAADLLSDKGIIIRGFISDLLSVYMREEKNGVILDACESLSELFGSKELSKVSFEVRAIKQSVLNACSTFQSELSAAVHMANDPCDLIKFFIRRLVAIYAGLSKSDSEGVAKCCEVGKLVSIYWSRETPIEITLSYLDEFKKPEESQSDMMKRFVF